MQVFHLEFNLGCASLRCQWSKCRFLSLKRQKGNEIGLSLCPHNLWLFFVFFGHKLTTTLFFFPSQKTSGCFKQSSCRIIQQRPFKIPLPVANPGLEFCNFLFLLLPWRHFVLANMLCLDWNMKLLSPLDSTDLRHVLSLLLSACSSS